MDQILQNINHEPRKTNRAFTIIELIVVLAIVGIVFGMSFPFFARFSKGSKLRNAATTISTVLRTARSYAISKRKDCWVIINDQATSSLYYAVKIYNVDGTIDRWHELPQGVVIDDQTNFDSESVPFPHDSSSETPEKPVVKFKATGGIRGGSGSIYIKDSEDNYKKITVINVTGRIKVTDESP